ncbi:hypothetical protein B0F90DRAFT_1739171 [Multifurca ochricompacta]|uniref:Uncharacterized protein n=1 Tax=Multifurca ochricompacta TaxID=376703 RepID=A0AAD4M0J9_9AGAM|nr:hypothetical protein B0F90DRAFT_1739171 [Multifurca ochricompacta]
MPHTIDLGLLTLATSEIAYAESSSPGTSGPSTTLPHFDWIVIPHPSSPSPINSVPVLVSAGVHNETTGWNSPLGADFFLRSTFFGSPLRRGSNSGRLPAATRQVGTMRGDIPQLTVRCASVPDPRYSFSSLRERLVAFASESETEIEVAADRRRMRTSAEAFGPLTLMHNMARVGCAGMLVRLGTLGRHGAAV